VPFKERTPVRRKCFRVSLAVRVSRGFSDGLLGSFLCAVGIIGVAIAGIVFAHVNLPADPRIIPLTFLFGVLADGATSVYLNAAERFSERPRAIAALSIVYLCLSFFALVTLLTIPWFPGRAPVLPVSPQSGSWMYVAWHGYAGIAIIIYAWRSRANRPAENWSRATFVRVAAVNIGSVIACIVVALGYPEHLPALVHGIVLDGYRTTGIGPLTALIDLIAALTVWSLPSRRRIDIALGFCAIALSLDAALNVIGGSRFMASWYAARVLYVLASTIVLVAGAETLAIARRKLANELARSQAAAARQGDRLSGLWKITSSVGSGETRLHALLDAATQALSSDRPIFGVLAHLERENIVIDATAMHGLTTEQAAISNAALYPRATIPLSDSLLCEIYAEGKTMSWSAIGPEHGESRLCSNAGFRSLIGTVLAPDATSRFLAFGSPDAHPDEPYNSEDHAYVDVVGAFSANLIRESIAFDRIRYQIEHDPLTGLHNRSQFRVAAREALETGARTAIAMIELDHFVEITDNAGHMTSDDVLVEVASRLDRVAPDDFVARHANSVFAILLRDMRSTADLTGRVAAYRACFREPFPIGDRSGGRRIAVVASIGVADTDVSTPVLDDLVQRANFLVSRVKRAGGNDVAYFKTEMNEPFVRERTVRRELVEAIERDQFTVLYQPTYELSSNAIYGAEALVRWDHPVRGRIEPADFIPFAERAGLIEDISKIVLSHVITDLAHREMRLPPTFRCYVNLSPMQLNDANFLTDLREAISRVPDLVSHLGLEITESAAMQHVERSVHVLKALRRLGFSVALDDFGTEYSSLAHLKRLPIDIIKIDRSFVRGLPEDEQDAALCATLLSISQQFGAVTLAEGVETAEQAAWLRSRECRVAQGFLFARPMPIENLRARLTQPSAIGA
jgi:diguanylate cyclase (GGDEF)-like protein